MVNYIDLDPTIDYLEDQLTPMKDLKTIQICPLNPQTTHIITSLNKEEEYIIIQFLQKNIDLFTWTPLICQE